MSIFKRSGAVFAGGSTLAALAIWLAWAQATATSDPQRRIDGVSSNDNVRSRSIRDRHGRVGSRTRPNRRSTSLAAQKWYESLLKQYPEFKADFKDVADRDNGYLQLLDLIDELGTTTLLPEELLAMLDGKVEWNPELFLAWQAEHRELFNRILAIAELPDQSVKGISLERYSFTAARIPYEFSKLLNAAGRVAIEAGDPEASLRFDKASMNLATHYDGTEITTLLGKTVAILIRLNTAKCFQEGILPHLADRPDDLTKWRDALTFRNDLATEGPRLMLGEWNIAMRGLILPIIITNESRGNDDPDTDRMKILDPEAFFEAYANSIRSIQHSAATTPPIDYFNNPPAEPDRPTGLSENSMKALDTLMVGSPAWFKGMLQANSKAAMFDAAIAILLGDEPPVDPVSGRPYIWDPENRTLSAPAGIENIKPLTLPGGG